VLLDHVEIVEQPFAGGPDVVVPLLGGGEPIVRVGDDPAGLVEALEEPGAGAGGPRGEPLPLRDRPRALRQQLRAEQLAPDRTGEQLVERRAGAAGDGAECGAGDGDSRAAGCDGTSDRKVTPAARPWPRSGGGIPAPPSLTTADPDGRLRPLPAWSCPRGRVSPADPPSSHFSSCPSARPRRPGNIPLTNASARCTSPSPAPAGPRPSSIVPWRCCTT
jgi:hypothetical protein